MTTSGPLLHVDKTLLRVFVLAFPLLLLLAGPVAGQDRSPAQQVYNVPPKAIVDLVDAAPTPSVSVGPKRQWMLLMERPSLPPVSELSQPELRIAGLRINPRTNGRSRSSYFTKLSLKQISGQSERDISGLPRDARIGSVSWSPDGKHIAFSLTRDTAIELWVAEVASARARRLIDASLNGAYRSAFSWVSDSQTLIAMVVPAGRGPAPSAPSVPVGPVVQENIGKKAPARTYQDLLKNSHDETLFEYYLKSQLTRITLDSQSDPIGPKRIIRRAQPSPDGKYLLVETTHRPFSYLVPAFRFPTRIEVWDLAGNVVREIADLPLAEQIPIGFGAVPTGPRSFGWRADAAATLYWVEAKDGGNPRTKTEVRDRVYTLPAPFRSEPTPLVSLGLRYAGIRWGNEELALVTERWRRTRKVRTWVVKPDAPADEPRLLFDYSSENRYDDPGRPVLRRTAAGTLVLHTTGNGKKLYLTGLGASPEGNRPFLDELTLATKETRRVWRSEAPYYEILVALLDEASRRLLTSRESKTEPPNYFLRDLARNDIRQLTHFPHPTPQLANVHRELVRYKRADGVELTGTLYLPPGHSPDDGPLPMLMWAYPREYKSAAAAAQVRVSPHRFVRIRPTSPLMLLAHGYAIFADPTMPIIGEGDKEPNDTYVEQLVASAQAAVDEVVRRGVAERGRIAIGGHSYGAFMVANLLAHSDLFAAGVSRSGAYNRTLTPFGFQAEERTFWEAPEVYFRMSPFMHADKLKEPILLIHGTADNNSGTFPIQSRRFYAALTGHGATARLVLLPHESHGYRARESVLHMLWETITWLDKYVGEKAVEASP